MVGKGVCVGRGHSDLGVTTKELEKGEGMPCDRGLEDMGVFCSGVLKDLHDPCGCHFTLMVPEILPGTAVCEWTDFKGGDQEHPEVMQRLHLQLALRMH